MQVWSLPSHCNFDGLLYYGKLELALLEYAAVNFISRQEAGILELLQKKRIERRNKRQKYQPINHMMISRDATQSTIVGNQWNTEPGINAITGGNQTIPPYQMVPYQGPTQGSFIPMNNLQMGPMFDMELTQEEQKLALGAAFYKEFARNVDKASRHFFPVSFVIFCLFYWINYLYNRDQLPEATVNMIEYKPDSLE